MKRQTNPFGGKAYSTPPLTKVILLLLIALQFSCGQNGRDNQSDISEFDPSKDYFPEKVDVKRSIGFDVSYHKHYKTLHLFRHYNDLVDTISFLLVQKGTPEPQNPNGFPLIQIPAERIVSMSTTHLGMFEMLESFESLKGIETAEYVSSPKVLSMVENGSVLEMAPSGALNVESVIAAKTDVLIGVGYPNSQNDDHEQLKNAGIPVLLNSDWQELDLLGRAEWVKMLAVLLNKEKLVNQKFEAIENEYLETLELVKSGVNSSPMVITGIARGDAWHVSGGRSFAYNVMNLANVEYPWKGDNSTGSLKLDFETVYEFGLKADFWVAPGGAASLDDITNRDSRYKDFKSFKSGNIYNIFGRANGRGGNDYYESGIVNPHIILKDVVKLFHPELLPQHELVYYKKLQ